VTLSQVRKLVFAPTQDGETFHAAAIRELREETGIQVNTVVGPVADRRFSMLLPSGETVFAVEQYFVVHAESQILSSSEWTLQETQVMADHHWWSAPKLRSTGETVWTEALVEMLVDAGVFEPDA
jgi:8-oxo-dGTP pyrophosphatase MutT (NUDIX family)